MRRGNHPICQTCASAGEGEEAHNRAIRLRGALLAEGWLVEEREYAPALAPVHCELCGALITQGTPALSLYAY